MAQSNGMGLQPLAFVEIEAYGRATGGLSGQDVVTIRRMSEAYLSERKRGEDLFIPPPWEGDYS